MHACQRAGLGEGTKPKVHLPPADGGSVGFDFSIARHPVTWLRSYYFAIEGGHVGVPSVDVFVPHAREARNFHEFMRLYLTHIPGAIGEMIKAYKADTIIKLENIKDSTVELFESIGIKRKKALEAADIPPRNNTKNLPETLDKQLQKEVIKAEEEYCDLYQYYA